MPTKPIERLMFAQGGECFFCRRPLRKADASVEHLVAVTHGGKDNDENCVACCKSLNTLFGRMSLKEKLHIILNQKGDFACPAGLPANLPPTKTNPTKPTTKATTTFRDRLLLVIEDLQKRGNARPGTVEKLLNTIKTRLTHIGESASEADALLQELSVKRFVIIAGAKVTYALPPKGA